MTQAIIQGEIIPDRLYTLARAKAITSWGATAFRTARRNGLKVLYQGRQGFVRGRDLIEYIEQNAVEAKPGQGNRA